MKILFTLLLSLLSVIGAKSQITLIGMYANFSGSGVEIAKWNPNDSTSLTSFPTNLLGWSTSTALFNPATSDYYLAGIANGTGGLFTFNSVTELYSLNPIISTSAFSNSSEIDMSTGLVYNVAADSNRNLIISEFNVANGQSRTLGIISDNEPNPGVNRCDASGFDSNNGILFYAGHDSISPCLYRIPVRTPVFNWSKTPLPVLDSANTYSFLNYDNTNSILYATTKVKDSTGFYHYTQVIEINTVTGAVISRGILPLLPGDPIAVSAFDQQSSNLLLLGWSFGDSTNVARDLFIFNTLNNTHQKGYVPGFVSEIVCDNHTYAKNRYNLTSAVTDLISNNPSMYPNPAGDSFFLNIPELSQVQIFRIINCLGQTVMTGTVSDSITEISTRQLSQGLYFVELQDRKGSQSYRLVVK